MLEKLDIKRRKENCAVRTLLESLSEADRVILEDNLNNPQVAHYALGSALQALGVRIADTTISRHRYGKCSCSRI